MKTKPNKRCRRRGQGFIFTRVGTDSCEVSDCADFPHKIGIYHRDEIMEAIAAYLEGLAAIGDTALFGTFRQVQTAIAAYRVRTT